MIDLMGNTTYTKHELRTILWEKVDQQVGAYDRLSMLFMAAGVALGTYTPTSQELAEIAGFQAILEVERASYQQDLLDNALLIATMEYERAQARLELLELSEEEIAEAQAVIDNASAEVIALAGQRGL